MRVSFGFELPWDLWARYLWVNNELPWDGWITFGWARDAFGWTRYGWASYIWVDENQFWWVISETSFMTRPPLGQGNIE